MRKRKMLTAILLCMSILGTGTLAYGADLGDAGAKVREDAQTEQDKKLLEEIRKLSGWKDITDEREARKDGEICDYPSLRDGEPVKEVKKGDTYHRIGTVFDAWSCVIYTDEEDQEHTGYILTETLEDSTEASAEAEQEDLSQEGMIGESTNAGVFAEASLAEAASADVVMAADGTNLKPLGEYRITHYCPCSICCGPWTDGITSTGVTAMTNRTIAVDPRVIPYGCNIVINGQVYVAEDCGGAIKGKRIDIYVATHQEAMDKGVIYTDVYLVQ